MTQVEVIDREEQRKDKENTPEGKRAKKIRTCLGIVAAIIAFSVIYYINHNPNAKKDMVTITVQGIEIVPGETKVKSLLDGGFQLAQNQVANLIDQEAKVDANSYYTMICLVKDKKNYGMLTIANDSNVVQEVSKCKVLKISVSDLYEEGDQAMVDGVAMHELTYQQLIDKYGEPTSREENKAVWENKGYFFNADVDEDEKINKIQSSYGRR